MEQSFRRSGARKPKAASLHPLLQWATGLPTSTRELYAGWFVERGNEELDAIMERYFQPITIKHGGGRFVSHWAIPVARLIVMADGVQQRPHIRETAERFGCAFGWHTYEDGRNETFFYAQVLLRELADDGYFFPLLLHVKSTLTDDVTKALFEQYRVLLATDEMLRARGRVAIEFPFYAFSIDIGPGEEVSRGRTQTKEITVPAALVPEAIESSYITSHYVGNNQDLMAFIETRMDDIIEWSVARSKPTMDSPKESTWGL